MESVASGGVGPWVQGRVIWVVVGRTFLLAQGGTVEMVLKGMALKGEALKKMVVWGMEMAQQLVWGMEMAQQVVWGMEMPQQVVRGMEMAQQVVRAMAQQGKENLAEAVKCALFRRNQCRSNQQAESVKGKSKAANHDKNRIREISCTQCVILSTYLR